MSENIDMHRADIIASLRKQGTSLKQLSLDAGLAPTTLSNALRAPWPKGERIIANAINLSPEEIWPSRYNKGEAA
ncbi:helix-turn-helix domain-containing protein [Photobacterium damselae subsp. damselae]|uniref:helix-turn-helix domain-containing protein n=1 Tax=Photobacterium damselae TaxID=38293 RepID=UPI003D7E371F